MRYDGVPVPHACPNTPETLEFLRRWIDAAATAGAEGILWDEPHFWSPGADHWPGVGGEGHWACHRREGFSRSSGWNTSPSGTTTKCHRFSLEDMDALERVIVGIVDVARRS